MHKLNRLPIAFVIPLFVGLIGFFFAFSQFKKIGTVAGISTTIPDSIVAAEASQPTALLVKEVGEVQYQLPGTEEFVSLNQNQINVPSGTTVKTGSNAFAHVIFPQNSLMSLSKNTEVVLNFEEKKIKIFQVLGNSWHRVEKVLEGNSYEVETPNTLATVRGTEFNVEVLANKESQVYVIESIVEVAKIAQENGQVITKEVQRVEKNEHVSVSAPSSQEPIKLIIMPEEKKNTDWFKRNEKLTEEINKAEEVETQKVKEQENQENLDSPTQSVTTAPTESESVMDLIKEKVIKDVMDTIQENEVMQEIDEQFGIVRPDPEEISNNKQSQNENSTSENVSETEDVGGMSTLFENMFESFTSNSDSSKSEPSPIIEPVIEPEKTDTPFLEPSASFEPENTPADTITSQEEKQSENPVVTEEPKLAEEQPQNDNPSQSAASSFMEMVDDTLNNLFE